MEFSRQECWNELLIHTPRDLPQPGIEPVSPVSPALAGKFFTTEPHGKPLFFFPTYGQIPFPHSESSLGQSCSLLCIETHSIFTVSPSLTFLVVK